MTRGSVGHWEASDIYILHGQNEWLVSGFLRSSFRGDLLPLGSGHVDEAHGLQSLDSSLHAL
jgi:hypothetical protein